MPPKKSRARRSVKQTQKQEQRQNINIKIGELPTKKPRRRPRRKPSAPGSEAPMRQLPPVVYQTLPQLTYYSMPSQLSGGSITAPTKPATSIVEPVKAKTTILEDVGMVGTEGPVEILDLPTKRETLEELITPVDLPRMQINPVLEGAPFDIPRMQVDPAEEGSLFDIPRMQVDPVEEGSLYALFAKAKPSSIIEPKPMPTTIVEQKAKRTYTKSGRYSKKQQPKQEEEEEERVALSPLSFEFGLTPEKIYVEPKRLYESPMTVGSEATKFRSDSPEGVITQKSVNKFFQPRERATSPKPMARAEPKYKGQGPAIRKSKLGQVL
jgi:hypothetical protein